MGYCKAYKQPADQQVPYAEDFASLAGAYSKLD